jgi:MscS family membrane protein
MREVIVRIFVLCVALLLIYFARRILTWIVLTPLQRMMQQKNRAIDQRLIEAVFGSVRLVLIAVGLLVSAQILAVGDTFFYGLIQVISRALLILATLTLVYRLVDILAPTGFQLASFTGIDLDERLLPFLRVAVKLFIIAVGLVIILQELGYDVSGLIAGIGIGGLAISLAAQDTISNLFGFASIVGDRPFNVGDYIKTSDFEGTVEHVGVRSTRLRQLDQTQVIVPNNVLANTPIFNLSRMGKRRVDITLQLSDETPANHIRALLPRLREMLDTWPSVDRSSVQVYFNKLAEHSFDIMIRCYVNKVAFVEMMAEQEQIQLAVLDIIEEMGLELGSHSIYLENLSSEGLAAGLRGQTPPPRRTSAPITPPDDTARG